MWPTRRRGVPLMNKADIINALGVRYGFSRYLEICTPTTGLLFADIDRRQFTF